VHVDPVVVETGLRNLLDNALKSCVAAKSGSIRVEGVRAGGDIVLAVSDDGLGFPPEDAVMIFEKFHRLGDELRRTTPGTGLGLYIVKRLVELSGGTVHAESSGHSARRDRVDALARRSRAMKTPARILVVDDEEHLATGIRENLEAEGYRTDVAHDGTTGLKRLRAEPFDLVVLDVMMPNMDGLELCAQLRRDGIQTPVLFLTVKGAAGTASAGSGRQRRLPPEAVPLEGAAAARRGDPAP
jgi:CheY-like chemotaxis protein/anti-sigma regulatory factor (Ser/Thr protein kinase)